MKKFHLKPYLKPRYFILEKTNRFVKNGAKFFPLTLYNIMGKFEIKNTK